MAPVLISLRGMFSSSFASIGRSNPESSSLASVGYLSTEDLSFNPSGIVSDAPTISTGASSEEDLTVGKAGQIGELGEANRLRITCSKPWSARPIQQPAVAEVVGELLFTHIILWPSG